MSKEHGQLFKGEMVRAILDGRKNQTRRLPTASNSLVHGRGIGAKAWNALGLDFTRAEIVPEGPAILVPTALGPRARLTPRVQAGDVLWVRETWGVGTRPCPFEGSVDGIEYRADDFGLDEFDLLPLHKVEVPDDIELDQYRGGWRPAIHMPRWACRAVLPVLAVRAERLHQISPADSKDEGIEGQSDTGPWRCYVRDKHWFPEGKTTAPVLSYLSLWEAINGYASLAANPPVWIYDFPRQ